MQRVVHAATDDGGPSLRSRPEMAASPRTHPQLARPVRNLIAGDPLRGIGVLMVVAHHVTTNTLLHLHLLDDPHHPEFYGPILGRIIRDFLLSLDVFFVLSGYLIARPFVNAFIADERERRPALGAYLRARFARVVPVFWFIFTVLLLWFGTRGASFGEIARVYLFAENYVRSPFNEFFGQAWTMQLEVVFYALIPLAAWLAWRLASGLGSRGRATAVALAAVAVAIVSLLLHAKHPADIAYQRQIGPSVYVFMPGVLIAALEPVFALRIQKRGSGRLLAWALLAGASASYLVYAVHGPAADVLSGAASALATGLLLASLLTLQWSTGGCWRVFDNRPIRWIGERSYSIFLIHLAVIVELLPIIDGVDGYKKATLLLFVATLAVSLPLGALTYRFIEVPARKRLRGRPAPKPAAAPVATG